MQRTARDLFAEFLDSFPAGKRADYEAWCRAYPDQRSELDALMGELEALRELLDLPTRSIAAHLAATHGEGIDPRISLGPPPREGSPGEAGGEPHGGAGGAVDLEAHLPAGSGAARYDLRGEVARGGMGSILEVWDRDLRRKVAMKVAHKCGVDHSHSDSSALARFLEEAQITGQLEHPGIVPVHELGLTGGGEVFFTMRLVRGEDLEAVLRRMEAGEGEWTVTRALGALVQVCEALAFAHSKGVIHRDVKPANIMVGRFGEVYLMDWGLAKVLGRESKTLGDLRPSQLTSRVGGLREELDDEESDSPLFTREGEVVGTPAYMPPEQARGELQEVGPAADIYSVGAVLYRILAGVRPYYTGGRQSAREVLAALLVGPPLPIEVHAPHAPAELVAIAEKAMAREPRERYGSMQALGEDLRAFLEGRVVQAFGHGPLLEFKKWVRRNKLVAAVSATALFALVTISLTAARIQAVANRDLRRAQAEFGSLLSDDLISRDPAAALAIALRQEGRGDPYSVRTAVLNAMGRLQEERFLPGFLACAASRDGRYLIGWQAESKSIRLWDVPGSCDGPIFPAPTGDPLEAAIAPDGGRAVVWSRSQAWLLDLGSGAWKPLGDEAAGGIFQAAFLPGGERFLTGGRKGRVVLWSASGEPIERLGSHGGVVTRIRIHPSGEWAATLSAGASLDWETDRTLRTWRLQGERGAGPLLELPEEADGLAVHPTQARAVVGCISGRIIAFDFDLSPGAGSVRTTTAQAPARIFTMAYHPGGELLAVGHDHGLALFAGEELTSTAPRRSGGGVSTVARFPHGGRGIGHVYFDGEGRLLTTGFDLSAWTYDLSRREGEWSLHLAVPARGHRAWIGRAGWISSARRFFTRTALGTHLWFAAPSPHLPRLSERWNPVTAVAIRDEETPGAAAVFVGRELGGLTGHPFRPGRRIDLEGLHHAPPVEGSFPLRLFLSGERLIVVWSSGLVEWLQPDSLRPIGENDLGAPLVDAVFDAASQRLLAAGEEGWAYWLDLAHSGDQPHRLDVGDRITALALRGGGEHIAVGTEGGRVFTAAWDGSALTTTRPLPPETRAQTAVFGIDFHPSRPEFITGGPDGYARFWVLGGPESVYQCGNFPTLGAVHYIGDGARLYLQHMWGGEGWFLDRESDRAQIATTLSRRHRSIVVAQVFDADRTHMLTASKDMTATWWDLAREEPLETFRGHAAPLTCAAIRADSAWAVTGDAAGIVRVWPLDPISAGRAAMPCDPDSSRIEILYRTQMDLLNH